MSENSSSAAESLRAVEYAKRKIQRGKDASLRGKEKLAFGEYKQALEFAARGNADTQLMAQIGKLISESTQRLDAPAVQKTVANKSKNSTAVLSIDAVQPPSIAIFAQPDICVKILAYCDWSTRAQIMTLNKFFCVTYNNDDTHWAWMVERLQYDTLLYAPPVKCGANSWKSMFLDIFPCRRMFDAPPPLSESTETAAARNLRLFREGVLEAEEDQESNAAEVQAPPHKPNEHHFNVAVCARMKPCPIGTKYSDKDAVDLGSSVVLPLHQRLKLIQQNHKCSASQARKILWAGDCNDKENNPWDSAEVRTTDVTNEEKPNQIPEEEVESNKKVAESVQACVLAVHAKSVLMCCPGSGLREFNFDEVVSETGAQNDVYEGSGRHLVVGFLNGKNACMLAYGQTGSGKTYTMFGPDQDSGTRVQSIDMEKAGIVPRACAEIISALQVKKEQGIKCALAVSYVEIFGDTVTDLLSEGANVGMWQGVAHRAVFTGDCSVKVEDAADLEALLVKGDDAKRRAATAMNIRSSRAHSVLLFSLHQEAIATGGEVASTLCFADLGGSEQVLKSEVASMTQMGAGFLQKDIRFLEAVNINLGLLALKTCITALIESHSYIPYQDSRLTMMLSSALGGNCRTCVVVTGSSERKHAIETMQTLRFGEACSLVTNRSIDSMAAVAKAVRALDEEIEQLEGFIRTKERWENVRVQREDVLHQSDEATGSNEIITTSKLVGAEKEREHLELLLNRRKILTGA